MGRHKKTLRAQDGNRVVVYLRVSTDEQLKGHGLDAQREACQVYAAHHSYVVVAETRDDGVSGSVARSRRTGLDAALRLCETGAADSVVAYAQDRFARSTGVFDSLRDDARRHGYRLESASDGRDLTAREDELSADTLSFVASIERKLIARRLYGGRRERSKTDGAGSGPVPWGYVRAPEGVAVDETAAASVRRVLALRSEGLTYQATADALNAEGVPTQRGRQWTTGLVYSVERHRETYETGRRTWDGVLAAQMWPALAPMC